MSRLEDVLEAAVTLDARDRAALAERLLASLDELSEEEPADLWADVAERRLNGYRAGRANICPAEEVHQKAQRLLG